MNQSEFQALQIGDLVIVENSLIAGHNVARVIASPTKTMCDVVTWRVGRNEWSEPGRRKWTSFHSRARGADVAVIARALFEAGQRLRDAQNTAAGAYTAEVAKIAQTGGIAA